ncbi:MAG: AAA family ATPase [Candidatus Omnitrophica bacterium]|nr:AAA family ATPase [Candidatus Omnitrophota bacterium]
MKKVVSVVIIISFLVTNTGFADIGFEKLQVPSFFQIPVQKDIVKAAVIYSLEKIKSSTNGEYRIAPFYTTQGMDIRVDIDLGNTVVKNGKKYVRCSGNISPSNSPLNDNTKIVLEIPEDWDKKDTDSLVKCEISDGVESSVYDAFLSGETIHVVKRSPRKNESESTGNNLVFPEEMFKYIPDLSEVPMKDTFETLETDIKPIFIELNRQLSQEAGIDTIINEDNIFMFEFSKSIFPICGVNEDGDIIINHNFVKFITLIKSRFVSAGNPEGPKIHDNAADKSSTLLRSIIYSAALHELTGHFEINESGRTFTKDEKSAQLKRGKKYLNINIKAMLFLWIAAGGTNPDGEKTKEIVLEFFRANIDFFGNKDEINVEVIAEEVEKLFLETKDIFKINYIQNVTDTTNNNLPDGFAFNESVIDAAMRAASLDYLNVVKIKLLQTLDIPEHEAEKCAADLVNFHKNLITKVKTYYTMPSDLGRYILTVRELHRARDDLIKYYRVFKNAGTGTNKALEDAYSLAIKNVYFDIFPKTFLTYLGVSNQEKQTVLELNGDKRINNLIKLINSTASFSNAYKKIARGIFSNKPILFIKDPDSMDIAEVVTEVHAHMNNAFFMTVPITPFTDRAQLVGSDVPRDPMTEEWASEVIDKATSHDIKWALAIIRNKVPSGSSKISETELDKYVDIDFKEWEQLKNTHKGLRRAVAMALAKEWGWDDKLEYSDGVLSKVASEAARNPKEQYYVLFDNIDAASSKVRAQLNMILLFGYMEIPERTGGKRKLELPSNLKLVFTMSSKSQVEDAAFYDRFLRKNIDPIDLQKNGLKISGMGVLERDEILKKLKKTISFDQTKKNKTASIIAGKLIDKLNVIQADNEYLKIILNWYTRKYRISTPNNFMNCIQRFSPSNRLEVSLKILDQLKAKDIETFFTEADLVDLFGDSGKGIINFAAQGEKEIVNILSIRYGVTAEHAKILFDMWSKLQLLLGTEEKEILNIGDIFRVGKYVKAILDQGQSFIPADKNAYEREIIAREFWLYFRGKLSSNNNHKNSLHRSILTNVCNEIFTGSVPARYQEDIVLFSPRENSMRVNGVQIPIYPGIHNDTTLYEKTGLVLTKETIKALSTMLREDLFGNGVLILEGPTGAGKTFLSEAYSKLVPIDPMRYTERPFYCEPVNSSTRIDKWVGYYRVDSWGDYPLFEKTEFRNVLSKGGVMAASELNTRVDINRKASLGYWLIPKARGDEYVPVTEHPRNIKGANSDFDVLNLHDRSLIIIDINPQESYASRGDLPDMLKAYAATSYMSNNLDIEDAMKMAQMFLKDFELNKRVPLVKYIAAVHIAIQKLADENLKLNPRSGDVITIREIWKVCEDIKRRANDTDIFESAKTSMALHYTKFWKEPKQREKAQKTIQTLFTKLFNTDKSEIKLPYGNSTENMTVNEKIDYAYLKEAVMLANRPTMFVSDVDSRKEKIVNALEKECYSARENITISYFTEISNLIGTFVPINQEMSKKSALNIIDRFFDIDPKKVSHIWFKQLGMSNDSLEDAPTEALIALATALDSIESGEKWNAKLAWKPGFITRAVRQYSETGKKVLLTLDNFHRLKPKVAVALNELLQGRTLHLEDGTILSIPDNVSLLALANSACEIPLSPAERSRWVRIYSEPLAKTEKDQILHDEIKKMLNDSGLFASGEIIKAATTIKDLVWIESKLIEHICSDDKYYFSFADTMALAKAVSQNVISEKDVSEDSIKNALKRERISIYGVGLRPEEKIKYLHDLRSLNEYNHAKSIDQDGYLSILGATYPISDRTISDETKDRRLIEIPSLTARERSMLRAFEQDRITVLEGPPGGGKTDTPIDLADKLGLDHYVFSSHDRVHISDFIGEFTQRNDGNYDITCTPDESGHYSLPFLEMFTHGGVYIIDEGAIGERAKQLIAWLGPLATGETTLVVEDHPGDKSLVFKKHPDFKIVITTNPYSDTPGREAIPVEVLSYAQKIWVDKDFTGQDLKKILLNDLKDFKELDLIQKNAVISRMIKFHFEIEKRIGSTLGSVHSERSYIGIRELKRWAADFTRIYASSDEKNMEFAFIEAMSTNYDIFVEDNDEEVFQNIILDILMKDKIASTIDLIAEKEKLSGEISLEPIDDILMAYQRFFKNITFRESVCQVIDNTLMQRFDMVPNNSINLLYSRAFNKIKTESGKQISSTGRLSTAYLMINELKEDENDKKRQIMIRVLAHFAQDPQLTSTPERPAPVRPSQTPGLVSRSGKFIDVHNRSSSEMFSYYSGALEILLLMLEQKNGSSYLLSPLELDNVVIHINNILKMFQVFNEKDLKHFVPETIKRLCSIFSLWEGDSKHYNNIHENLINFFNINYVHATDPFLLYRAFELQLYYANMSNAKPVEVEDVIEKYYKALPQYYETLRKENYKFSDVYQAVIDNFSKIITEKKIIILDNIIENADRGYEGSKDGIFIEYTKEERVEMLFSAAKAYIHIDEDKALSVFQKALDLTETLYSREIHFDLKNLIDQLNSVLTEGNIGTDPSLYLSKLKLLFKGNTNELAGIIKDQAVLREMLLKGAEITPEFENERYLSGRILKILPHPASRIALMDYNDNKDALKSVNNETVMMLLADTCKDIPNYNNMDIAVRTGTLMSRNDPIEDLIKMVTSIDIKGTYDEKVRRINNLIPFFLDVFYIADCVDPQKKRSIILSVFEHLSYVLSKNLDNLFGSIEEKDLETVLSYYSLMRQIEAFARRDTYIQDRVDNIVGKLNTIDVSGYARKFMRTRKTLSMEDEGEHIKIGYVKLPKGDPLDKTKVPNNVPSVNGIYSEESIIQFLANCFASGRSCLLFTSPGARVKVVFDKLAQLLSWEKHVIDCYADMSVYDLCGGLSPVLGSTPGNKQKLTSERGLLSSHLVEDTGTNEPVHKLLLLHNVDFLSPKVRAALHNFLMKGYIYFNDSEGKRIKLVKPSTLHISVTMSKDSEKDMADAFFNRFSRRKMNAMGLKSKHYSEFEKGIRKLYGVSVDISRRITKIIYSVMVLDERSLWPSGYNYSFCVKDGFALARNFVKALDEAKSSKEEHSDAKILFREAIRVIGGALSDTSIEADQAAGKLLSDRDEFVRLVLKRIFRQDEQLNLNNKIVLDSQGLLKSMDGVIVQLKKGAQPLLEIDEKYRLSFIPPLISTAGTILRAWQEVTDSTGYTNSPDMVILTGETGVAKTSLGFNLSEILGLDDYAYSTHQGSHVWDITADIAPDGKGGYYARKKDFARKLEQGNAVLMIDEGNIKAQFIQALAPLARGEKTINLVIPGEGRRLSRVLLALLNDIKDTGLLEKKFKSFSAELFNRHKKQFNKILDSWTSGGKDITNLKQFYDFAEELSKSGYFEIEIGRNVNILVTQNPSNYDGRDVIDPVIANDSRNVWASSVNNTQDLISIVETFFGLMPARILSNIIIDNAKTDLRPLDILLAELEFPLSSKHSVIDRIKCGLNRSDIAAKKALIERDIAFLTEKKVSIVAGKGFAISSDGTKVFVPYDQLLYSPQDVITGSIIHEIRHQRYSLSYDRMEVLAHELFAEQKLTDEEYASMCTLTTDQAMNNLHQLAENARTDSIEEPGYTGENDYLMTFRKETFMDNRIDKFTGDEKTKIENDLVEWAHKFPDQAFLSELANAAYFGKFSKMFDKYPDYLKEEIIRTKDAFLFATIDPAVKPDFEKMEMEEDFEEEKAKAVKTYIHRIATTVVPAYQRMLEKAQGSYESTQNKSKEMGKEFLEYMEPYVDSNVDPANKGKGKKVKRLSEIEKKINDRLAELEEIKKKIGNIRKAIEKEKDIDKRKNMLRMMASQVTSARTLAQDIISSGVVPLEIQDEVKMTRDDMFVEFRETCLKEGEKIGALASKETTKSNELKLLEQKILELIDKTNEIAKSLKEDLTSGEIDLKKDDMEIIQKSMDDTFAKLASANEDEKTLKEIAEAMEQMQEVTDALGARAGTKQAAIERGNVKNEIEMIKTISALESIGQETEHWKRVLSSNPISDSLYEAHVGLSGLLVRLMAIITSMSSMNSPLNIILKVADMKTQVLTLIDEDENLLTSIIDENEKPALDISEEILERLSAFPIEAKEITDSALSKVDPEIIQSCAKLLIQGTAILQEDAVVLLKGKDVKANNQKIRENRVLVNDLFTQVTDLLRMKSTTKKVGEERKSSLEAILAEIYERKEQALATTSKITTYEGVVPLEDVLTALKQLGQDYSEILTQIHSAVYLRADANVLDIMFTCLRDVGRCFDEVNFILSDIRKERADENKEAIDEIFQEINQKYEQVFQLEEDIKHTRSIIRKTIFSGNVMELINGINSRLLQAADLGASRDSISEITNKRNRLILIFKGLEIELRDIRSNQVLGSASSTIELILSGLLAKADKISQDADTDTSEENIIKVLNAIYDLVNDLSSLIKNAYDKGSDLYLIEEMIRTRENLFEKIDKYGYILNSTYGKDIPENSSEKKKLIKEISFLWKGSFLLREEAASNIKKASIVFNKMTETIAELRLKLNNLLMFGNEKDIEKALYSRNEIFANLDAVGMILREQALSSALKMQMMTGSSSSGGGMTISQEEAFDKQIAELISNASKIVKSISGETSRKELSQKQNEIAKSVIGINSAILQLSQMQGAETKIFKISEAREIVWGFYTTLSEALRKHNQNKTNESLLLKQRTLLLNNKNESIATLNETDEFMPLENIVNSANKIFGLLIRNFSERQTLDEMSGSDGLAEDNGLFLEQFKIIDDVCAIMRKVARAYSALEPHSLPQQGGGASGESSGGSSGEMLSGDMQDGSQGNSGSGSSSDSGGSMSGGSSGGMSSGSAGKGAPARAPLSGGSSSTSNNSDGEENVTPLSTDPVGSSNAGKDENDDDPTPSSEKIDELDKIAENLVTNRLEEMRKRNDLQARVNTSDPKAKRDAQTVINYFKQKDAEELVEEASSGLRTNIPRFVRSDPEPFDVDIENPGEVSLAFALYVDNSGSIGSIKTQVSNCAAYIIHLFEGICGTRTGKDKFAYGIKSFDNGINSFKDFNETMTQQELQSVPKHLESILGSGGTDISLCIRCIINDFENVNNETKVAILITDGQDSVPPDLAREAASKGITLIGIGIGSQYSANVANIFERYLILNGTTNEISTAIVRLAAQLALGKKLDKGDLRKSLGLESTSIESGVKEPSYFNASNKPLPDFLKLIKNLAVAPFWLLSDIKTESLLSNSASWTTFGYVLLGVIGLSFLARNMWLKYSSNDLNTEKTNSETLKINHTHTPKKKETIYPKSDELKILPEQNKYLRDIKRENEAVQNFIEAAISACMSHENGKVVMALHRSIYEDGANANITRHHIDNVLNAINKLKRKPGFKELLSNLVIERDFENVDKMLSKHDVNLNTGKDIVFCFAPGTKRADFMKINAKIKTVFINFPEEKDKSFSDENYYFPMFEVMIITLVNYLGKLENIPIDLDNLNIKDINMNDPTAFMVFNLMPRSEKIKTSSLSDRYKLIIKFINNAA